MFICSALSRHIPSRHCLFFHLLSMLSHRPGYCWTHSFSSSSLSCSRWTASPGAFVPLALGFFPLASEVGGAAGTAGCVSSSPSSSSCSAGESTSSSSICSSCGLGFIPLLAPFALAACMYVCCLLFSLGCFLLEPNH